MSVKILETSNSLIYEGRWWGTEDEKAKATEDGDFVDVRFEYDDSRWDAVVDFSESSTPVVNDAVSCFGEVLYLDREVNSAVRASVLEAACGHRARTGAVNLV